MNTKPLRLFLFVTSLLTFFSASNLLASGEHAEYGPYVALVRDANIVKDVKVEENGRIYLKLNPDYKEKEIILKNSMSLNSGYRNWFNGKQELVSPANQGKEPNGYTDWVTTTANYIEYRMDGKLILHLAKKSVVKD
ncbi:hypothetical protein [Pelagicoccus albus]|uniref:Uncharacterized protein n=1 Tax=Pelagicoccus albus TaxID=415222 RepID=A0A7X1E7L8_9BACT|nr:hypothetical protein [Pelagicoccus albus]MBC2605331.1 hypothetical protein [Pelagicoccus albus]